MCLSVSSVIKSWNFTFLQPSMHFHQHNIDDNLSEQREQLTRTLQCLLIFIFQAQYLSINHLSLISYSGFSKTIKVEWRSRCIAGFRNTFSIHLRPYNFSTSHQFHFSLFFLVLKTCYTNTSREGFEGLPRCLYVSGSDKVWDYQWAANVTMDGVKGQFDYKDIRWILL